LPNDDELSRHEVYYPPRNIHPPQNPGYCPPPEPLPIQQQFGDLPPYPVRPQERFQSSHRQPPAPAGGLVQHSTNPTSASARPVLKDCTNQPTPRESPRKPEPAPSKREPFTVPSGTCSAVVKPEKKKKLKKTKKEDTAHSNEVYPKNLEFRGEQFIRDNVNKDHATYRCGFWRQTATSKCGCKLRYYPTRKVDQVQWINRDHSYRLCYTKNGKVPPDEEDDDSSESESESENEYESGSENSEDSREYMDDDVINEIKTEESDDDSGEFEFDMDIDMDQKPAAREIDDNSHSSGDEPIVKRKREKKRVIKKNRAKHRKRAKRETAAIHSVREDMLLKTDELTLSKGKVMSKEQIWREVKKIPEPYRNSGKPVDTITKTQCFNRIDNVKRESKKGDMIQQTVEKWGGPRHKCFVHSYTQFADEEGEQKMIVFSRQPLLMLFNGKQLQVYFDGTFHCVPLPFKQCLIVMVWADREQKYVPGIWILLTGKTKRCYYEAISWFARCKKDGELPDINYAGVDFEPAFFQAIDKFLGELFKVGCDFHFKQGPKKKCDEIGMPKSLTTLILTYLDYARVLPRDDMKDKGIYYLQHLIYDETSSLPELDEGFPYAKWLVFWEYFERVWCRNDFIEVWSLEGLDEEKVELQNKTNCILERYNRRLNEKFPRRHPNILSFAESLFDESTHWINVLKDVADGLEKEGSYSKAEIVSVPGSYANFDTKKYKKVFTDGFRKKAGLPKKAFDKKKAAKEKKARAARKVAKMGN